MLYTIIGHEIEGLFRSEMAGAAQFLTHPTPDTTGTLPDDKINCLSEQVLLDSCQPRLEIVNIGPDSRARLLSPIVLTFLKLLSTK